MTRIAALLLLVAVLYPPSAESRDLLAAATVNGVDFCAVDNNAFVCGANQITDANAALGVLAFPGLLDLNGLLVSGSVSTQQLSATSNLLTANSIDIVNNTAQTITASVSIGATNFIGPATSATTTGSGTWVNAAGSSGTFTWWNDPSNQQGGQSATDRPGDLVDLFTDVADGALDSFAHNGGPFTVTDPGLFSMTLGFDLELVAGGTLNSRGQAISKNRVVPEPAVFLLIGLGLVGYTVRSRRSTKGQ